MPDELAPQFERAPRTSSRPSAGPSRPATTSRPTTCSAPTPSARPRPAASALLLTGDRDMYQCAGDGVTVLYVRTGGKGAEEVGPDEVRERYGIGPELVPDFIALRGDPSDGLPGAKGVGPKTAAELLREHGSLEAMLDNAIREQRPKLRARPDRSPRRPARLQGHRHPARRRRRAAAGPRDRLGRRRRRGPRARHEPPGRAARSSPGRGSLNFFDRRWRARSEARYRRFTPTGWLSPAGRRQPPSGDDRPDALEQDEAPLGGEDREHGEDRRADQVEREVEARVGAHALELDRREGGEDQQGADRPGSPGPSPRA